MPDVNMLRRQYESSDNSMSYTYLPSVIDTPSEAFSLPVSYPTRLTSTPPSKPSNPLQDTKLPDPYFSFSCYRFFAPDNFTSLPDVPIRSTSTPLSVLSRIFRNATVVKDYLRFLIHSKQLYRSGDIGKALKGVKGSLLDGVTVKQYFEKFGYGHAFARDAFLPLFSGVCTCSLETLEGFPAAIVLEYVATCMPFGRMAFVSGPEGIQGVCRRLSAPVHTIRCGFGVERVDRVPVTVDGRVVHKFKVKGLGNENEDGVLFDHVIFATQANQCKRILEAGKGWWNEGKEERGLLETLGRFQYERSLVVCHTDEAIMPPDRRDWRCLNFARLDPDIEVESEDIRKVKGMWGYDPRNVAMCTHYSGVATVPFSSASTGSRSGSPIPSVSVPSVVSLAAGKNGYPSPPGTPSRAATPQQDEAVSVSSKKARKRTDVFQSTNPVLLPNPSKVLSSAWFERCIVTLDSMDAINALDTFQGIGSSYPDSRRSGQAQNGAGVGDGGVWFVGSYASHGIPLLEGCVTSAARVVKGIVETMEREEGLEVNVHAPWKDGLLAKGVNVLNETEERVQAKTSEFLGLYPIWWMILVCLLAVIVAMSS
ncbi:hypothetical protein HDU97_005195 [Phlyctochytrium planicorne]|nr:hypothetical protein HDU97_005195 [Phlyctochytrium planicorne]